VKVESVPESESGEPATEAPPAEEEQDNWFVSFIKALFGLGS
jgi:hypothetical protein